MTETLIVRTFAIDVSDAEVRRALPWKVGRLFPWLFTETSPVCFLGVGQGWRGWKENGTFRSYALLKAIPRKGPLSFHVNRVLAWTANFIDLVRMVRKVDSFPLVVLSHTPQFGLGAAIAKVFLPNRIRFVVRVIGNDPSVSLLVRRSPWRFRVEQGIERFVLSKADVVLPMGKYTYDLSLSYGVDPRKLVTLPFPVTWPHRPESTDLPERPTVLFCGRLIKIKGVHILLQAMKLVKERIGAARLVIVGDTDNADYRRELEDLVDSLGLRHLTSMVGWVSNDSIGKAYQDSWVVVVPSLWEEGLGMVMVEAGLTGRPVIASELGGISDFVVHGKNGFLVAAGDIQKLAAAITNLLQSRSRTTEMGKQNNLMARKYLADFDRSLAQAQRLIYHAAAQEDRLEQRSECHP